MSMEKRFACGHYIPPDRDWNRYFAEQGLPLTFEDEKIFRAWYRAKRSYRTNACFGCFLKNVKRMGKMVPDLIIERPAPASSCPTEAALTTRLSTPNL